jgi:cobaltochelatase CobN
LDWHADWHPEQPVAPLLFYRSHLQAANTGFIDVFCQRLQACGLNPLPIAVASLKERACLTRSRPGWMRSGRSGDQHHRLCPVQPERPTCARCAATSRCCRRSAPRTTSPAGSQRAGPGRARPGHAHRLAGTGRAHHHPAVSFKDLAWRSERSQSDVVCYRAHPERMDFVAELARRWVELARLPTRKRVALVLANYPTRDGRIGNGVGLDTPAPR